MSRAGVSDFDSRWFVVAAVDVHPGERSRPGALAARDAGADDLIELAAPGLLLRRQAPYPTSPRDLLVTIDAQVLVALHLALGWRVPERVIDIGLEARVIGRGGVGPIVGGLAGALLSFGLPSAGGLVRGSTPQTMHRRLRAVETLWDVMAVSVDLGRALLRGRYLCAVAKIEATGIPVDGELLQRLAADWRSVRLDIIDLVDAGQDVFRQGRLDPVAFGAWLQRKGITWPRDASGALDLTDGSFREMARACCVVRPLKELMTTLDRVDPSAITVGRDGRNRTPLRPFASRTGRNQPSAKASVLGSAAWLRHLIRPMSGTGLTMIDWQQQEFGIAAALSGDIAMQTTYRSGDPYLGFAVLAGAAPPDATAKSHAAIRERFKACALGLQYGMGADRLARQTAMPTTAALELIRQHRRAFATFWAWSDRVETHALLHGCQTSAFGWRATVGPEPNPRALRNFPMQANGAEMLRLACCLLTEAGIAVTAPNHDAVLIEAPLEDIDDVVATAQRLMAEASEVVLDGFTLRTSARSVHWPERWADARGQAVWSAVTQLMAPEQPARMRDSCCAPPHTRAISLYASKRNTSDGSG